MLYISIDEVKSKFNSYSKISNLVSSGELEICYRVNNYFASVDEISGLVHSIECSNQIFIAENTEELKKVILGQQDHLSVSETKHALKLKHCENLIANDKEKYRNFLTPEVLTHKPDFKWVFLEQHPHLQFLKDQIESGVKVNSLELFPEFHNTSNADLEKVLENINLAWGVKKFARDELFITTRSWNKYKRNPKTNSAIDRKEENTKEDLHQLILILKHIILEKSKTNQKQLNDQVMDLIAPRQTKLNPGKINTVFSEANSHEKSILRKNIINIFDLKSEC